MRPIEGNCYKGAEAAALYIPSEDGPGRLLSRQGSLTRTRNIDVAPGQVLLVGTDAEIDAAIVELGLIPFVRPAIAEADADALRAQQLLAARDRIDAELTDPKLQVAVERMQSTVGKVRL